MRRPLLLPLVPVYAAALWAKRQFVEGRAGYARRLQWPVVSVGSLSAGGAGKTPVVAALAELLQHRGFGVDVLSRGYGRNATEVERVNEASAAQRFGDEPLVLARGGVTVFVGADRYEAGLLAEASPAVAGEQRIHLLDDGLQHRGLARTLDVVLLTAEDARDWLLPAGNLREPLGRLRDASAVVLREEEAEALLPVVRRLAGAVPVWVVRRRLVLSPVGGAVVAFCGIARPEGFFTMLRGAGVHLAHTMAFGDHHVYRERDVERLLAASRTGGFVTTEKDAVKLTVAMRERLEKVAVAGLRVEFLEEEEVAEMITARIRIERRGGSLPLGMTAE